MESELRKSVTPCVRALSQWRGCPYNWRAMSVGESPGVLSRQAGIGHPVLYSGSRFEGEQKNLNKATSYNVEVILQVDYTYISSELCLLVNAVHFSG